MFIKPSSISWFKELVFAPILNEDKTSGVGREHHHLSGGGQGSGASPTQRAVGASPYGSATDLATESVLCVPASSSVTRGCWHLSSCKDETERRKSRLVHSNYHHLEATQHTPQEGISVPVFLKQNSLKVYFELP